jgi:hypothetical protein
VATDPAVAHADLHLFGIPNAIQHTRGLTGPHYFPGSTMFQGENRPYGAILSYMVSDSLAEAVKGTGDEGGGPQAPEGFGAFFGMGGVGQGSGPATIEILHADSVIRTLKGPAEAGMNRTTWGLQRKGIPAPDADEDDPEPSGPEVLPGTYAVRITVGDHETLGQVDVLADPRRPQAVSLVQANLDVYWRGQAKLNELQAGIRRLTETKGVLDFYGGRLADWDEVEAEVLDSLTARTDTVKAQADRLLERLRMPPGLTGIRADTSTTARVGQAINEATSTPYVPSPGRRAQLDWALQEADEMLGEIEAFYATEVAGYRQALRAAGFDPLGG